MIARVLEGMGIATVTLNMFHEIAEYVQIPRTVHTKFVYGAPFGDPHNTALHVKVIEECLKMVEEVKYGGEIYTLPFTWKQDLSNGG